MAIAIAVAVIASGCSEPMSSGGPSGGLGGNPFPTQTPPASIGGPSSTMQGQSRWAVRHNAGVVAVGLVKTRPTLLPGDGKAGRSLNTRDTVEQVFIIGV